MFSVKICNRVEQADQRAERSRPRHEQQHAAGELGATRPRSHTRVTRRPTPTARPSARSFRTGSSSRVRRRRRHLQRHGLHHAVADHGRRERETREQPEPGIEPVVAIGGRCDPATVHTTVMPRLTTSTQKAWTQSKVLSPLPLPVITSGEVTRNTWAATHDTRVRIGGRVCQLRHARRPAAAAGSRASGW